MRTTRDIEKLIDAALGATELDLLVRGGRFLDIYRGEWIEGDIGIANSRIVSVGIDGGYQAKDVLDASGKWIVPGFFDPHFHAGGSHLSPTRLAEAFLERGTTSTVCDFQEHYVVGGIEAARFALDEAKAAGLRVYYLVPIHMYVVDELGIAGKPMRAEDLLEMLEWPETVAINEPPPGPVLAKMPGALEVIAKTLAMGKIYAGHAPEFTGKTLQAYLATGASSDHETGRAEDAWMKLGLGMRPIMRHGSAAPDMPNLIEIARDHRWSLSHMMLGTDEVDPIDLSTVGHMDHKVRVAREHGVDLIDAYRMITINPAEYYRVDHDIGSIAPGRYADLVILGDPEKVEMKEVVASGRPIFRDGTPRAGAHPTYPEIVRSRADFGRTLKADDFHLEAEGVSARVRVVGVRDGSLLSTAEVEEIETANGQVPADSSRDLLKMAVIERFTGKGQLGLSFVRGFGFDEGSAVATTYCHPYYNVLVVGADEAAMALAANRLAVLGGGIVAVRGRSVVREWPLDVVGIFSTKPLEVVHEGFRAMNNTLHELGCSMKAPVLALSFVALNTIPHYGLTSKGLYDVLEERFVSPFANGETS
jgi:adenine deaminase